MDAHDDDEWQVIWNLVYFLDVGEPNNGLFFATFEVGTDVCTTISSITFLFTTLLSRCLMWRIHPLLLRGRFDLCSLHLRCRYRYSFFLRRWCLMPSLKGNLPSLRNTSSLGISAGKTYGACPFFDVPFQWSGLASLFFNSLIASQSWWHSSILWPQLRW